MRPMRALPLAVALVLTALSLAGPPRGARAQEAEDAPATQVRVALDRVLAEHAFLIIEVMRLGLEGGQEFEAAADSLDANTEDLIGAIAGIYGDPAGDAVGVQWRNHIAFIVDYARALADADTTAANVADQQLRRYVTDFSALLSSAIAPLPQDAVEGLVQEHIDQLEQVAAFDAADFGDAYPAVRATYEHMFMIGDGLALGIVNQFPDRFTGGPSAFSPATDMRLTLDRLLGEHTALASLAMRASLTDAPDEAAAAEALADNAAALADTIGGIYGDEAGNAFSDLWTRHTSLYIDYVAATKAGDTADQETARRGLADYSSDFTAFLASANPFLSGSSFEGLVGAHTEHLLDQVDAYADDDFVAAYRIGREGFAHTGVISAGLAAAIADQFPQRFPDASMAPAAGGGPTGLAAPAALLVLAVVSIAAVASVRRRLRASGA